MPKFYFTCGQKHSHTINGKTWDKDSVLEVIAEKENNAIEVVFSLVGPQWAFCYTEEVMTDEEIKTYYPNGICTTLPEVAEFHDTPHQ